MFHLFGFLLFYLHVFDLCACGEWEKGGKQIRTGREGQKTEEGKGRMKGKGGGGRRNGEEGI